MTKTFWFLIYFVAAILFACPELTFSQSSEKKNDDRTRSEVRLAIDRWAVAVRKRDSRELSLLFADDLFITDSSGATRGKAEEIEILKPTPGSRMVSVENENIVIRPYNKALVAVVTGLVRMVFAVGDKETEMAMRYTSVWEIRNGTWQLAVLQSVRVPKPKSVDR
jgi:ketosteroid isomerase-like protein